MVYVSMVYVLSGDFHGGSPVFKEATMIKVLVCRTGQHPTTEEIGTTLEAMQKAVGGGYIQMVPIMPYVDLVCDEEGLLKDLPYNRSVGSEKMGWHHIRGDFFFCRHDDEGEAVSLTDEDLDKLLSKQPSILDKIVIR
jgi:hypothetical protein